MPNFVINISAVIVDPNAPMTETAHFFNPDRCVLGDWTLFSNPLLRTSGTNEWPQALVILFDAVYGSCKEK